jgi:hypothetical protein
MARSHLIRAALMLLLLAAAAPALASQNSPLSSAAAKSGNGNGKDGKGNDKHCPDAEACGLATTDELTDAVSLLLDFFGKPAYAAVTAYLSADSTACEDVSKTNNLAPPLCVPHPNELVPAIGVQVSCPDGTDGQPGPYQIASQVSCYGLVIRESDGAVLGSGLVASVVADGPKVTCKVASPVDPVPDGARLAANMFLTCTQDLSLLGGGGGGGNKAAAAGAGEGRAQMALAAALAAQIKAAAAPGAGAAAAAAARAGLKALPAV